MKNDEQYLLVLDTEQYAGSFERDMCAHITGHVGDCGVGEHTADLANESIPQFAKNWFSNNVLNKVDTEDDSPCSRPCTIWPTPGWSNNGNGKNTKLTGNQRMKYPAYLSVAIYLEKVPPTKIWRVINNRAL